MNLLSAFRGRPTDGQPADTPAYRAATHRIAVDDVDAVDLAAENDRLRAEIGRLTSELHRAQVALADHDGLRTELVCQNRELSAQLRMAKANEPRTVAYWRRRFEREYATNRLLDDRLARAEGRPTFGA